MDIKSSPFAQKSLEVTDVYTNLHGLQALKNSDNQDESLKKIAQQFESLFLNMMMKSMRSANEAFSEDSLFNNKESQMYNDMLDQQRSLSLAHKNGFGIAEVLYRQLSQSYSDTAKAPGELAPLPSRELNLSNRLKQLSPSNGASASLNQDQVNDLTSQRVALSDSPESFVNTLLPIAEKTGSDLGVDPELLIAQAALETGWGKFVLADEKGKSSFNLFNIKANGSWDSKTLNHQTLEFNNGTMYRESAEFRAYDSVEESFKDYERFLKENPRYKEALENASDQVKYIENLQEAGYATDPDYSNKVLRVLESVQELTNKNTLASNSYRNDVL